MTLYIKRTAGLFRFTDFRHATKLGICSPVKEQRHDKMVLVIFSNFTTEPFNLAIKELKQK